MECDLKIDKGRWGASGSGRCVSSLIDLLTEFDLVDRFRLDHSWQEMWTWLGDSPFSQIRFYRDRVLVGRADSDFVFCPMFHWIEQTYPKLVRVSLRLANRPSLAGYCKFSTSLLEIRDFREQLETLIQRALVGAVTWNKSWGSLKYRIRNFAIKYSRQLKLDRARKAKSLEDRLTRAVKRGDALAVDLARRDLEREASARYKAFVFRTRLTRVSNDAFVREEKVRMFAHRYIKFVKSPDGHARRLNREMRRAFRTQFRDRFACCPDLLVQEFRSYLADFLRLGEAEAVSCEGLVTECEVRDALK